MQTNSYGNNLRILRGVKFKKILDHDFATAQPLSKSGGDQTIGETSYTLGIPKSKDPLWVIL